MQPATTGDLRLRACAKGTTTMGRGGHFFRFGLIGVLTLLAAASVSSAARSDVYVPDDLRPWLGWILHDREYLDCPFYFDQRQSGRDVFICAWPGELKLDVDGTGARFSQPWAVYASEQWLPLPGDGNVWPEQVTANGQAVEVLLQGGTPSIRLSPGRYTISGRLGWTERPRELTVPPQSGLLALTIDGNPVVRPERSRNSVWLAPRETESKAEDRIDVQVYRLVADDVPTRLTTIFRIDVAGSVREVVLAPTLPDGFVPLAIDSALPARLESDGNLRLQVRPGRFEVRLLARGSGVLGEVLLRSPASNLPDAEIWSYRSNDRLRVTVPEGITPVDPEQVSAPGEWLELPAFRIEPGERLRLVEQSRGMLAADNQLRLDRELWMDFDGGGFVFSDSISGSMRSGWRLDMIEPYALLSASEGDENLLVTLGPGDGMTGVELRRRDVDLEAIGRSESRGRLPASGWQTRFDQVEATLNLPPGNKLFAAVGADRAPGSWVERWKLLDFFLVLIVTIATTRLFGKTAGAIAFLALALSWHESGAPQWIWLNLLAAVTLVRVAPGGRLRKSAIFYRGLSFAALVLVLVPFFAEQLRIGIYPQLEPQRAFAYDGYGSRRESRPAPSLDAGEAMQQREQALKQAAPAPAAEEIIVTGTRISERFSRYAPNAIVQAGPGIPSWSWNSYSLSFSGPVDVERRFRLIVMPRWFVTTLRFAEVFLLLAFAAIVAFEIFNRRWNWPAAMRWERTLPALLVASLFTAAVFVASPAALAQTPSPEILEQLEQRLLEPPPCVPRCAEIAAADVAVAGDSMTVILTTHALEEVAVPLPGSLQGWRPESVELDGTPSQVYRRADQTLWVRASRGSHRIVLRGPLPPVDSMEVPFPASPRIITAASEDWVVTGIRDRRLLSGSLQLARRQTGDAADTPARWESARFPVFVRIERTISLDLDWRVNTQVVRVAPEQGALSLDVPLLDGESIVSGDFQIRDGAVLVSMNPGQSVVSWESGLPRSSPLSLGAAAGAAWKEVWRIGVGSIWHVSFDGVPESESDSFDGVRVAEFYPRSGESLTIEAERPDAKSGTTLAFDSVSLQTEIGARSRNVEMILEYRSTRGAQHTIRLPDDSEVLSVTIDGRNEPLRASNGELSVPILPGEHDIEVRWRHDVSLGLTAGTPAVDLAAPASNIELGLQLPQNRWVLFTSGARLGPAVMYWSELTLLLLVAVVLGRIRLTPLRTRHWLLLGLGFSTFSWAALALVAVWLLLAGARARWPRNMSWWRFDLLQLFVAAITITALATIVVTVPAGLLGTPDMHIAGNGSWGNSLQWFADRSDSLLPAAAVVSLPMWVYKLLVLAWALWLSFALLRWLPWVWSCFVSQGLWRSRRYQEAAGAG
jgi:hypothetical protein